MFTGIIRYLGKITERQKEKQATLLTIASPLAPELTSGDSVAVNGACLTVLTRTKKEWTVRLMAETLQRTNLGNLHPGAVVNLERPLQANATLDGHFVLGHVDGLCPVTAIAKVGKDKVFTFQPPVSLLPYVIPKGSVTLDGVSLTVVDVRADSFTVSMMPYTLEHTLFGQVETGYQANLEVDVLGKYVESFLKNYQSHVRS